MGLVRGRHRGTNQLLLIWFLVRIRNAEVFFNYYYLLTSSFWFRPSPLVFSVARKQKRKEKKWNERRRKKETKKKRRRRRRRRRPSLVGGVAGFFIKEDAGQAASLQSVRSVSVENRPPSKTKTVKSQNKQKIGWGLAVVVGGDEDEERGRDRRRRRRRRRAFRHGGVDAEATVPRRLSDVRRGHVPQSARTLPGAARVRPQRPARPRLPAASRRHLRHDLPQKRYLSLSLSISSLLSFLLPTVRFPLAFRS